MWRNTYLVTFQSNGRLAVGLNTVLSNLCQDQRREIWVEIEEGLQRLEGPSGFVSPCEVIPGAGSKERSKE